MDPDESRFEESKLPALSAILRSESAAAVDIPFAGVRLSLLQRLLTAPVGERARSQIEQRLVAVEEPVELIHHQAHEGGVC